MSLGEKKQLEVANICYANVAGNFAMFTNEKNRGPTFRWELFVKMMERDAPIWMEIHAVRGKKEQMEEIKLLASCMSKEIAQRLVDRAFG